MDRWVRTAWNAFWVGLGASAVLIGQTVLAPPSPAPSDAAGAPIVRPHTEPRVAEPAPKKGDAPAFSRPRVLSVNDSCTKARCT